ncbi:hypothetical protein GIB67_024644 [Kingdonia uniflora]|uniref:Sulfotransferase n=1 Tax=Kingdonia uniflora TaxID=39325 RepID=A0A7J7LP63_9MAGN|nr:hypothetical protein GIB67_024644 [Kingdonia uniflora]
MATPQILMCLTTSASSIIPLLSQLPKQTRIEEYDIYQWEGFWYLPAHLEGALAIRSHFEAQDDDVIIISPPKAGTTWLKALIPTILNGPRGCKNIDDQEDDPLVKITPQLVVLTLEDQIFSVKNDRNPDLSTIPSPRIFHTHLPYTSLPNSIKNSKCKIVYISRNPKDVFVSLWHFMNYHRDDKQGLFPIEKAFDSFCNGVHFFGPYFDHVLEYWKKSLDSPSKILFLKYEEMKSDSKNELRKLALFLGRPFVEDEEVENVLWKCSFERLKNLEVNKNGIEPHSGLANSSFFRLGTVGDWKNSFTPEMEERINGIARLKFEGSGLDLYI